MKYLIITTILCVFILSNSCKHKPDLTGIDYNTPADTTTTPCSKDSIYFNRDIYPILNSNCAMLGCHDATTAAEGINLTTYAKIISTGRVVPGNPGSSKLFKVISTTSQGDIMPPRPKAPLTAAQIDLIKRWIEQGARNTYCVDCDSTAIKFSVDIFPIIQNNCTGCHNSTTYSGNVYLRNYADVKSVVDQNKLQNVILWTGAKNMPPSAKLPDCKIKNILKWVDNGALNN